MLLRFPDAAAVSRALTSGAIPESVAAAPAEMVREPGGRLWVSAAGRSSQALSRGLAAVGGEVVKGGTLPEKGRRVSCWVELLPLVRSPVRAADIAGQAVLFEMGDAGQLAALSTEMLRLGNDRQSLRRLTGENGERILLKVVGPPHYTVLRADPATRDETPLTAYVEGPPRVWVELGYRHPLGERLVAPEGRLILVRSPQEWMAIPDEPFEDLERSIRFTTLSPPIPVRDEPLADPISIRVSLVRSAREEPAELWVASGGIDAVDAFVADADDALLDRLSFAIAETEGESRVILRARPGRGGPPVVVLDALPLRSYLKIPHLFVPCGRRLHPPLRREAVRRLLADDPDRVTWLEPDGTNGFRTFTLHDAAFRPLPDWVEYVLDHARRTLEAWMQAHQFEFDDWVSTDDETVAGTLSPKADLAGVDRRGPAAIRGPASTEPTDSGQRSRGPGARDHAPAALGPSAAQHAVSPASVSALNEAAGNVDEGRARLLALLQSLERSFVERDLPLDDDAALPLLAEMAELHASMGNTGEASACWLSAVWESETDPRGWLTDWTSAVRTGASSASSGVAADDFGRILRQASPAPADVLFLAARLASPANSIGETPPQDFAATQPLLETNEALLPVRAAWLAWLGIVERTGDVLALARARDRILERLYQSGLSPQQNLPAFLRSTRAETAGRSALLQARCLELRQHAKAWIERESLASPSLGSAKTAAYADLLFAWGLARLHADEDSERLASGALSQLAGEDPVHRWLSEAFRARVEGAGRGDATPAALPATLLQRLDDPSLRTARGAAAPRYLIDRLRRQSRVLEPLAEVDAYRRAAGTGADDVTRGIELLCDVSDAAELRRQVDRFVTRAAGKGVSPASRAVVFRGVLDVTPRLGQAFSRELLPRVLRNVDEAIEPLERLQVLDRSLFVASHFDLTEMAGPIAQQLGERFARHLPTERNPAEVERLASLLGRSLAGLRRLGMHDIARGMLDRCAAALQTSATAPTPEGGRAGLDRRALILVLPLQLVPAWIAFDQSQRALPLLDEAELLLKANGAKNVSEAMHPASAAALARSYIAAVGALDVDSAGPRLEALFASLRHVHVPSQADSHYSASLLAIVETAVVSLVSDELAVDAATRRRLDESESLVRRRIHRDVRRILPEIS